MSTRTRSESRPRRRALTREEKGKAAMFPPPLPPPPQPRPPSIEPPVTSSTAPEDDDDDDDARLLPPPFLSRPSPSPSSSSPADLRWLVDLDLACYSSFALCLFISALATRDLGARLLSLAVAAGCAAFAAAAGLAPRAYSRRRDLAAVAFRVFFAAVINPMMAGGRRFPVEVESWARFAAGRMVLVSTLFLGATARLPGLLSAALAVAQTALLFRAQRSACEAVLVGYVGSGGYYLKTQRLFDGMLSASSWLLSAVSVEGGGNGRGGGNGNGGGGGRGNGGGKPFVPPPPSLSSPFSTPSSSCRSSSEDEVRACVAVMTELQVVAALVLVAFGTRPPRAEEAAAADDDDGDGDGDGDRSGRETRRQARRRLQRQRDRVRRRRRLFHRRAFLAVASLGVLRVAWALLRRDGGGEGGVVGGIGGVGGGGAAGTSNEKFSSGWSSSGSGGSSSSSTGSNSGSPVPSIVEKLKLVLGNGLFAP